MRPRLQIIRGLPGSGKSTLALKMYPNVLRLETDFVYESGGCYKFSKDREEMATKWLKDSLESAMSCGIDIVCPSVYPKLSGRLEAVLGAAFHWGYDVYVHTMPLDVNYGSLHNVPVEVFLSMKSGFESDEELWDRLCGKYTYANLEKEFRFGLMPVSDAGNGGEKITRTSADNADARGSRTVISDIRLVANGDQWGAVVELDDGTEIPLWAVNGNDGSPPWIGNDKEYERWYNLALDEAHRQGYILEGEC